MLRILDPNRSLTPKMWVIVAVAFVVWVLAFLLELKVVTRATHAPNSLPGFLPMMGPALVLTFGEGLISDQLKQIQSPKLSVTMLRLIPACVLMTLFVTYAWFNYVGGFVVWSAMGLFVPVIKSRQWSERAAALQGSNGAVAPALHPQ